MFVTDSGILCPFSGKTTRFSPASAFFFVRGGLYNEQNENVKVIRETVDHYTTSAVLSAEHDLTEPVWESVHKRLPWLGLLLVLGLGVSAAVGLFEGHCCPASGYHVLPVPHS